MSNYTNLSLEFTHTIKSPVCDLSGVSLYFFQHWLQTELNKHEVLGTKIDF